MQIFWNDHKFAIHLKTSFQAFRKKIIRQIQHFNRFNWLTLKNEHRKFEKNLFRHNVVLIHFLRFDVIYFQWKTRLQIKKKRDFYFHEKHSDKNDENHFKNFSQHNENSVKHWISFVINSKSDEHRFLRRNVKNHHQFNIFAHQSSKNSVESSIIVRTDSASENFLRSIQFFFTN